MANIKVESPITIYDGQTLTFRSPADCSQVTGLIVYYPNRLETESKVFQFADAHGENIGDLDLFAANAVVKVILDTDSGLAFVQNADTNAYLEERFRQVEKAVGDGTFPANQVTAGTFAGQVVANATAVTNLGTKQMRNIYAGTEDMEAGVTPLSTGDIYLVYE